MLGSAVEGFKKSRTVDSFDTVPILMPEKMQIISGQSKLIMYYYTFFTNDGRSHLKAVVLPEDAAVNGLDDDFVLHA